MESPVTRRRRERLRSDLPHVVDLLAATLAAGSAPDVALQRVSAALDGPVVEELARVTHRLTIGIDPLTAWSELGRHPQLGPLGRCVARSVDGGASVADAMARLADDLRQDLRAAVEARARAVGVKAAVPLGVCMLPGFLLVGVAPLVAGLLPVVLGR
jgi:Flp pilus assembly protein TadB